MKLKQRAANREALEMAASLVENSDLEALFANLGDEGTVAEYAHNQIVLAKAQDYAVARIRRLFSHNAN